MIKPIVAKVAFFIFATLFIILIPFYCVSQKIKGDTILVIMLVSDTSDFEVNTTAGNKKIHDNSVTWVKGYKVIDWTHSSINYLYLDKRRLSKRFYVWMDKTIKY